MRWWYLLRSPRLYLERPRGTMHIKSTRRTALERAGAGVALAWSAALLMGCDPRALAPIPIPAPAVRAPTGPTALWHMDETSGSAMQDSSGSHSGKLHSVQLRQPGSLNTAYGFTGSSEVTVPSAGDLSPGNKNITITIQLKATSVPKKPDWDLIRKGTVDTRGGEWKMEYQPNGKASCGFKGAKSGGLSAGPALNNGKWHTVQCVKTSASIKLIVDGQTYSKSVKIGSITNSAPVVIGSHGGSEFFNGALDEASIQIG
jgi:hypothetical protein